MYVYTCIHRYVTTIKEVESIGSLESRRGLINGKGWMQEKEEKNDTIIF